ncbi:hypothetical protein B0F90DRAFT_1755359 [Multifurca ochricompacta]|uniref:C2H2-type domain-containing protein n=1 Tax=Multifurca ochricompacta TaxID=376703 RepID=A0AAD4QKM2_9AGAM|nr:hypothetical protein B0F90DRAFT_1755359 [Multifurca ochricompacta]
MEEHSPPRVHGDAPLFSSLYTVDQYEEATPNQGVEKGQRPNLNWCPDCDTHFKQKQSLNRHRKDKHSA